MVTLWPRTQRWSPLHVTSRSLSPTLTLAPLILTQPFKHPRHHVSVSPSPGGLREGQTTMNQRRKSSDSDSDRQMLHPLFWRPSQQNGVNGCQSPAVKEVPRARTASFNHEAGLEKTRNRSHRPSEFPCGSPGNCFARDDWETSVVCQVEMNRWTRHRVQ